MAPVGHTLKQDTAAFVFCLVRLQSGRGAESATRGGMGMIRQQAPAMPERTAPNTVGSQVYIPHVSSRGRAAEAHGDRGNAASGRRASRLCPCASARLVGPGQGGEPSKGWPRSTSCPPRPGSSREPTFPRDWPGAARPPQALTSVPSLAGQMLRPAARARGSEFVRKEPRNGLGRSRPGWASAASRAPGPTGRPRQARRVRSRVDGRRRDCCRRSRDR